MPPIDSDNGGDSDDPKRFSFTPPKLLLFVILIAGMGLVVVAAMDVILIAFGAVLYAVFLHGLARPVARRTPIPYTAALAIIIIGAPLLFAVMVYLLGPRIGQQIDRLIVALPRAWARTTPPPPRASPEPPGPKAGLVRVANQPSVTPVPGLCTAIYAESTHLVWRGACSSK